MPFPELLARQVRHLRTIALLGLAGCPATEKPDTEESAVEKTVCENGPIPEGYELVLGFVTVPVGTACPEPASLSSLETADCCPLYNFAGPVCRLDNVMANQEVVTGEGIAYFQDATAETENPVDVCVYEALFENTGACCGRPLWIDGQMQVAESQYSGQGQAICAESGRYWAKVALLEHASIASFARCSLELMQWGAPLHLLAATQRAGEQEVDHAELSLALAERLLGERITVGGLKLGNSLPLSASRLEFAEAVLREGAIGESLSVLDAAARLANAGDRQTRMTLERILKDESAHAELAWDILKWLVQEDPSLLPQLRVVMAEERAKGRRAEPSPVPPRFGLIDAATQQRVFEEAWEAVLLPAFEELALPEPAFDLSRVTMVGLQEAGSSSTPSALR
jgi:hypothetical protein